MIDQRQLTRLKWFTTLVPACAIYLYETVRHSLLEPLLPTADGNLIAGLLALVLAYGFSELVLHIVARFQADAVKRSRELATLTAMTQERERLSRELHDSLAQAVAYLLVRIETVSGLVREERTDVALDELEQLRGLAEGEAAISRRMVSRILEEVRRQDAPVEPEADLTPRERAVLELVAASPSNREIADHLVISEHTVKGHLKSILAKLHVRNRRQASGYGIARGWAHPIDSR